MTMQKAFKQALLEGKEIIGTFQKTPSMMISEVLAMSDLQAICLDAEHSPFDRRDLDACIFACRSAETASLVRTQSSSPEQILNALDCGATGVVVPHVDSLEKAEKVARVASYGDGGRGYAGSTRAAAYASRTVSENLESGADRILIAQIEDLAALDEIDGIAQVHGIDCLFIGMMDLSVSLGCTSPEDAKVIEAAEKICAAANTHNRRLGIFIANLEQIPFWRERGVSLFLLSSEHGFIKQGVQQLLATVELLAALDASK